MPLTNAEMCKNYRNRKKNATPKIIKKTPLTSTERSRMYRLRKKQLTRGFKSSVNEVLYTPSSNSRMTLEPLPQPVTTDMSNMSEDDGRSNALDETSSIKVKEEVDVQIKLEVENSVEGNTDEDNPFKNVELHIKNEVCYDEREDAQVDTDISEDKLNDAKDCNRIVKCDIKEECNHVDDSVITYDYPNFEDSMDSSEATALCNVETCVREDIKEETDVFEHSDRPDIDTIKQEDELTVTETHLISNKVINTTSTITNPHVGVIESQTTKTLVMEIHPMIHTGTVPLDKMENPEEILPTTHGNDDEINYHDSFQLNSITGNVLSLEQEAYGLLEAKKQRKISIDDRPYSCPKCSKTYKSATCLRKHMKLHTSIDKYEMAILKRIKICQKNKMKKYDDDSDEDYEDETLKKSLKYSEVDGMKARQDRFDKRNKHWHTESNTDYDPNEAKTDGYECSCGQVFQRKSRMETCLRSHDMDSNSTSCYTCLSCTKQFKDKSELQTHRKRSHRRKFPCKFCPTDYNTRKELFKHLRIHQKVQLMEYKVISEVMEGKQKLRCFMCDKTCTELSELKSHVMEDHEEPYVCPKCSETFPKIIDFGQHTKTEHPDVEGQSVLDVLEAFSKLVKAWKCEECELQFHEADKLAKHQIEKHNPELKAEPQYQCDDCRRVFVSHKGLTSHRRIHHSSGIDEIDLADGVLCVECRKICKDEAALTSHMRLHSPDRKYPCKFCDFRFATPEKRKAHMELHTGDMKYVCFICEYQCTSENRLKRHKQSDKHLRMRQYLRSGQYKEQVRKSEDESSAMYTDSSTDDDGIICDICGEKFESTKKMLEHKETHPFIEFPNDDKPTRIFFK